MPDKPYRTGADVIVERLMRRERQSLILYAATAVLVIFMAVVTFLSLNSLNHANSVLDRRNVVINTVNCFAEANAKFDNATADLITESIKAQQSGAKAVSPSALERIANEFRDARAAVCLPKGKS